MNIIKTETFNTNNGWGFGGKSGTLYMYDNNLSYEAARNHHRHTDTSSANQWYYNVDEDFRIPIRGATKVLNGDVYVYKIDDSYRAWCGLKDPTKMFEYFSDEDLKRVELVEHIKINESNS